MEDFPVDHEQFHFHDPVWVLLHTAQLASGSLGIVRLPGTRLMMAPLFTDKDLADTFNERYCTAGVFTATCLPSHDDIAAHLRDLAAGGYTHVVIDPRGNFRHEVRVAPIDRLLAKLSEGKT